VPDSLLPQSAITLLSSAGGGLPLGTEIPLLVIVAIAAPTSSIDTLAAPPWG